ncbi:uncharacterized protein MYCGRDRAFT_94773 [Zymoseptoria tritici IPO323]|uniref:Uncharacterized protein n=1 Tax=Zymoseptoria tritici (strain CBS 115943 / IPO323) TaxID=336722 RepID=F9XF45_ZYMTI|nr:uncharacterized protein MYCGRDRAFT_94773 [Zymoseptoria tritici IPO323]EGP85954.1 hypothetical protein MYCGRDRAFT_94773 [Zymoseptoria tritici IPO323]
MPGVWEPTRGTIPLRLRFFPLAGLPDRLQLSPPVCPTHMATGGGFSNRSLKTHHKRRRGLPYCTCVARGDTSATRPLSRADQHQLPRVSLNTLETRGGHLYKHKFDKSQTEWGGLSVARPIQSHQSVRLDPAHPNKYKFAWSASADQVKHRKVSGMKTEKKHPVELLNLDSTADDGPPHPLIVSSTALSKTSSTDQVMSRRSELVRTLRALCAQSSQLMVGLPSWEVTT